MPAVKQTRSVGIDIVPLSERYVKDGGIVDGKIFILEVNPRRLPIPAGARITKTELRKLAGQDVAVYFSTTRSNDVMAIGL